MHPGSCAAKVWYGYSNLRTHVDAHPGVPVSLERTGTVGDLEQASWQHGAGPPSQPQVTASETRTPLLGSSSGLSS